jgi:hypothetical protein
MTNDVEVHWQKIKFKHLGEQGVSNLEYNINNGRFDTDGNYDNKDWIGTGVATEVQLTPNLEFDDSPF